MRSPRLTTTAVTAAVVIVAVCVTCAIALGGNTSNAATTPIPATSGPSAPKASGSNASSSNTSASGSPSSGSAGPAIPADGSVYIGLDGDVSTIPDFDAEAGIDAPAVRGGYVASGGAFSSFLDDFDAESGTAPMVSWKIDFTGNQVTSGKMDSYLRAQAAAVKAFGKPVFVRPDWEMNGNWMPLWSLPAVSPAQYIAAWRHVVDVFRGQGVHNVAFVWCPNTGRYTSHAISAWYPGDSYVNWVGIDGYPRVSTGDAIRTGLDGLDSAAQLSRSHNKPLMLAEWAATLPDPDNGWAFDLVFNWAKAYPDTVKALIYFDYGTADNDHLLADHPVGAAEFRYLIQHGPKALLTVSPAR